MKRLVSILLVMQIGLMASAQNRTSFFKTVPKDLSGQPEWVSLMYSADPDIREVEYKYHEYYKKTPFEKNIHTQNFKHWMMLVADYVNDDGKIREVVDFEQIVRDMKAEEAARGLKQSTEGASPNWRQVGPLETFNFPEQGGHGVSWQANVYCFDQSVSQPNICYAGIEGGALYKSTDKGLNWMMVSQDVPSSTINDVKVAPSDHRIVYFTSSNIIYKSINGGINWDPLYHIGDRGLQLLIHPSNPDIVFCAAQNGFYRTTDAGANWEKLYNRTCWDVNFKPGDPNVVYLLQTNASGNRCQFYKSSDGGASFNIMDTGWYIPTDSGNANDIGGKIGVTPADPERVYASLIGESKADDNGWIGVYRSNDSGESWVNPNLPDGGPYSLPNHPNLATINPNGTGFHQGFFNYAFAVSHHDPDLLWVGTLSLNKSTDGGAHWIRIGSYNAQQDIGWIHPDIQDLHVLGSDVWVCCDGGINYSSDQLRSHVSRNQGLAGSNYWGFGQGWNEDVMVGGRYHNGNSGYHENYGPGNSLRLGGAEASTGYVNPQYNRKAYFSDISTQILPGSLNGSQTSLPKLSRYPNEAYTESHSSEIEFDPRYSDHLYLGNGGILFKSENGGGYFEVMHGFGSNARVLEIEIARSNPKVIYVVSQPSGGYWDASYLYRSEDGGDTFKRTTNIPSSSRWRTEITINPENEDELWTMSITGSNGRKVYRTLDGGDSWENMTTDMLDNHRPQDIQYQAGTEGVVYLATTTGMFYYDPETADWVDFSDGLPASTRALEMKPFYAKNRLRMATGGHAIWEADLAVHSRPLAQPMTHTDTLYTINDTVYFESYSVMELENAEFTWTFNPKPLWVSSFTARNPKVIFNRAGTYDVSLEVTDQYGNSHRKWEYGMVTLMDLSGVDLVAGKAMECYSSGDYATTDNFNLNTEAFSITAWVRPDGIQPDYAGIAISNGTTAGLNFRGGNNTLGYHWPGGSWSWNSGLIVVPYQWSHVALVANGDQISLYVNGVGSTHQAAIESVLLTSFGIGSYKGWASRNFTGQMDEVSFWKRALTEDEIRLNMHLTKENQLEDPDLVGYYQFNEPAGQVLNKAGSAHANLYGNAQRIVSEAPVGSGQSVQLEIISGGSYAVGETGLILDFPSGGTLPDGKLVVSQLDAVPVQLPNAHANSQMYWIIDNYGSRFFSPLVNMQFRLNDQAYREVISNPGLAKLWKRRPDADGNTWEQLCGAKSVSSEAQAVLSYNASCQVTGFGHFIVISDDADTPLLISQATGIERASVGDPALALYPNPIATGESLQLKTNVVERMRLRLYNLEGKLVLDQFLEGALQYDVLIPKLEPGFYVYQVTSQQGIWSGKLLLE